MSTNFSISGRHIEVTPALEDYAKNKLSKVQKNFNKVTTIHVVLSIDSKMQKAEAEVRLAGDPNSIFAEALTEDMYKSIDEIEHKLRRQVQKYHDKHSDHQQ